MAYNSKSIQTLDQISHIRKRTGMYIGSQGSDGIFHLFKEVIDNSVDEHKTGHGDKIYVTVSDDNSITVQDGGRGIPFDKVIDVFTKERTSGKFDSTSYEFSAGLNGFGLKIVNALSSSLEVETWQNTSVYNIKFIKGVIKKNSETTNTWNNEKAVNGTTVTFTPDPEIFGDDKINIEDIKNKLFELANIYPGLVLNLIYQKENINYVEKAPLISLHSRVVVDPIFSFKCNNGINILIDYCQDSKSYINSFINSIRTDDNGSHVDAVFNSIGSGLKRITGKIFSRSQISQGLRLTLSAFFTTPNFKGQSKSKVSDSKVYDFVYNLIYDGIYKELVSNKEFTNYMVELINKQEAAISEIDIKKAVNNLKNNVRENRLPAKLSVAYNATPDTRELFIVEGESAAGGVKIACNKRFQEVLGIKGKITNAFKSSYSDLINSSEVNDIFLSIGSTESSNTPLRTKNVFIFPDADSDGSHIISLLLSLFSIIYPSFIKLNNLYIVKAPLFSLLSGDMRFYGHDVTKLKSDFKKKYPRNNFEVYRNKGLGEMQPDEMISVIHPDTRVVEKVELNNNSINELTKLMGPISDIRRLLIEELNNENK